MLTGEYLVLNGAKALALPTKLGQAMTVKPSRGSDLIWVAKDTEGNKWFEAQISLLDFTPIKSSDETKAAYIGKVLKSAVRLNSEFLDKWNGFKVETTLEFDKEWGLGSSSTLIHNVAQWAEVSPYFLHFKVSNGSGYDVACAGADGPIEYMFNDDQLSISQSEFDPKFKDKLFFIYLGHKQNSALEVEQYLKTIKVSSAQIDQISDLTEKIASSKSFGKFEQHLQTHEEIIGSLLKREPIKKQHFSNFWGSVKSLGAWGGDFIVATSDQPVKETMAYFKNKGYETIIPYRELILGE